jgi:anti-sigma28 factor (negative regulator of flagellin synthesis)
MNINSATATSHLTFEKTSTLSVAKNTSDKAVMNTSADSFVSLVQQASSVPEVRSELVDAYKSRISAGHYPAQDVIEGFIHLMGGRLAQMANSGQGNSSGSEPGFSASPDTTSPTQSE